MSEGQKSSPSRAYRVRLVPWLWFLTRAARCFVYLPQKETKSIKEVFDEVIKRVKSYGHVESWHDAGGASILSQRKVEHCVQYRETDFNFLSRTLEKYASITTSSTKPTSTRWSYATRPTIRRGRERDSLRSFCWRASERRPHQPVGACLDLSLQVEQTDYDFTKPIDELEG